MAETITPAWLAQAQQQAALQNQALQQRAMYSQQQAILQDQLRRQQMEQAAALRAEQNVAQAIPSALKNLWAIQQADEAALAKRDAERRRYMEANRAREQEMAFRAGEAEKGREEKRNLMEREYKLRRRLKRSGTRRGASRHEKRAIKIIDDVKKSAKQATSIPRQIQGRMSSAAAGYREVKGMESAGLIPLGYSDLIRDIAAGLDAPGSRFEPTDPADLRAEDLKGLQQQEKQVQGLLARAYLSEAKGESAPFATTGQAKGAHKGEIGRLTTVLDDIQKALKTRGAPPTNAPVRTQSAPASTPYWQGPPQAQASPEYESVTSGGATFYRDKRTGNIYNASGKLLRAGQR
jgi:hypothetical protein